MAANPIRGTYVSITADGDEYSGEISAWNLTPEEAEDDDLTFGDAAGEGTDNWTFNVTVVQDLAGTSFHSYVWAHRGETASFVVKAGPGPISADNPAHTFDAVLDIPKGTPWIGAEASRAKTRSKTEMSFAVEGEPVRDVTP